ncbi:chemotaxis protein CheC [Caldalkalibacillus salinus]|uniref:chemotaxis protein CheC n=1 Tax=Caldalkalibacillus salinus TaxID=2803787 RepID=UPI0019231DA9|nr:chemotaxis protein CheC [Caldalkalibacillus salinus]
MTSMDRFKEQQLDVLREIGNIGSGNAATALSKLVKKSIDMNVPHVHILSFNDVIEYLGGPERIVVAVFLKMEGDVPGNLFFFMQEETAKSLSQTIIGRNTTERADLEDMEVSALQEVGNILSGSYLSSLSDLTNLHLSQSVPALAIDMAGAILGYGLTDVGKAGDYALIIDTEFLDIEAQQDNVVSGQFVMIPEPSALSILFKSLGVSDHG